jgi:hypothetical protein
MKAIDTPKLVDDPIDFAHHMVASDGFAKAHEVATQRLAFWTQVVAIIKDVLP